MTQTKKVKETIIRDYGTNNVSFKQTTKGIWYCDGLSVYCDSIFDGLAVVETATSKVEDLLKKLNKTEEQG